MHFRHPYIWEVSDYTENGEIQLGFFSRYEEDNPWDMAAMYVYVYPASDLGELTELQAALRESGYETAETQVGGAAALDGSGLTELSEGNYFNNRFVFLKNGDTYVEFDFYLHEDFGDAGDAIFQAILDSVSFS